MHTLLIVLVFCAAFGLAWFVLLRRALAPERFLVAAALVFGLLYNLVLTPGMAPDEYAHMETAYRYSNVFLGKPYATETGGLLERREDAPLSRFMEFHTPTASAYAQVGEAFRFFCAPGGEELTDVPGRDVRTGFAGYLCSALGLTLGRALHLGLYPTLYLGRLMNLGCYVALFALALRLAPVKKYMLALAGLTPMAMQLCCTFSYDGPILGMCLTLTAYCLRLVWGKGQVRPKQWLILCGLSFLLVPCKFVYIVILTLLFFLPPERAGGRAGKYGWIAAAVLCGLAGFLPQNLDWFRQYFSGTGAMVSDSGNALGTGLYTLDWVMAHPGDSVQMLLHTVRQDFDFLWGNMLSGRLSVFEPVINWSLILLVALVLGAMKTPEDAAALAPRQRLACLAAFLAVVLGTFLVMLFMYTPYGSEVIWGVQGRYFLPVLPLLLLALGTGQIQLTNRAKSWIAAVAFSVNGAVIAEVFLWILSRA